MKSSRVIGVLVALVLPLLPSASVAPASAAGATVTIANMAFTPARVKVAMGESVTWNFQDAASHTATSFPGRFFDTGIASRGQSRTVRFASAGIFGYHCRLHPMMTGKVRVPMTATGSEADGWKVRWRVGTNPKGRSYDVQMRKVGTRTWSLFRQGTTAATGSFEPRPGTWQLRARTIKGSVTTGWSPVLTLS
jgi:plastocyanin